MPNSTRHRQRSRGRARAHSQRTRPLPQYITTGTTLRLNSDLRVEAKEWHQEGLRDEDKEHGARERGESAQIGTIKYNKHTA